MMSCLRNDMVPLVIVIDDSSTVRKILETSLSREGFAVQSFPDGVEALRCLFQPGVPLPDLVFLDIGLPKMNGYQVALAFKEKPLLSHIPIVFLSCHNGVLDRLKARLAGGKSYLSKPFTTRAIISTARYYTRPAAMMERGA